MNSFVWVACATVGFSFVSVTDDGADRVPSERPGRGRLEFLLERTLLKVDVVQLTIVVDETTAAEVDSLVAGRERTKDLEHAVATRYLEVRYADIELEFRMSISHERFLDGALETTKRVVKADLIGEESAERIDADLAARFSFLEDSGVREGDRLRYILRGDSIATRYVAADGETRLDDLRVGPERRLRLLGSYFVPKTNFRDGLLDAVFEVE